MSANLKTLKQYNSMIHGSLCHMNYKNWVKKPQFN